MTLRVLRPQLTLWHVITLQGKYAEADFLYKRATEIWEKALGPDDLKMAAVLNNRAVLLKSQVRAVRIFREFW